jgi:hypothetical protein
MLLLSSPVFICELIGACIVCNHWSHKMRRGVTFDVNLRPLNPSDTNNRGKVITIPVEALDLSLPLTEDLVVTIAIFGSSPNENGRYWLSTVLSILSPLLTLNALSVHRVCYAKEWV